MGLVRVERGAKLRLMAVEDGIESTRPVRSAVVEVCGTGAGGKSSRFSGQRAAFR